MKTLWLSLIYTHLKLVLHHVKGVTGEVHFLYAVNDFLFCEWIGGLLPQFPQLFLFGEKEKWERVLAGKSHCFWDTIVGRLASHLKTGSEHWLFLTSDLQPSWVQRLSGLSTDPWGTPFMNLNENQHRNINFTQNSLKKQSRPLFFEERCWETHYAWFTRRDAMWLKQLCDQDRDKLTEPHWLTRADAEATYENPLITAVSQIHRKRSTSINHLFMFETTERTQSWTLW